MKSRDDWEEILLLRNFELHEDDYAKKSKLDAQRKVLQKKFEVKITASPSKTKVWSRNFKKINGNGKKTSKLKLFYEASLNLQSVL